VPILLIISILSPLIPLVVGIKKRFTLLWLYVITGFIFDCIVVVLKRGLHLNQSPATNLFVVIEFILVSILYKHKIINRTVPFYIFVFSLALFFVANTLSNTVYTFNTFGASFFSFSFIVYSISGFYVILSKQRVLFLEKSSFFWMNVAFIIYASGNLFLFLFKDYLRETNDEFFLMLWRSVFQILNISKNIFLALALSPKTTDDES
jgi:hypothetical protein